MVKQNYKLMSANPVVTAGEAFLNTVGALHAVNPNVAVKAGSALNLASMAARAKKKASPVIADNGADQEFPGEWQLTNLNEQFLLIKETLGEPPEEGEEDLRQTFVAFGSDAHFARLCSTDTIYIDGTFKVCPHPYAQYFTFHCFVENRSIPCIHLLATHKTEALYSRILQWIKGKAHNERLEILWVKSMSDFESGVLPALQEEFPLLDERTCNFHLLSLWYHHLAAVHLLARYKDAALPNFRNYIKKVFSLPFLPVEEVLDTYMELYNEHAPPDLVRDPNFIRYHQYILDNYVGDNSRYPKQMWNVSDLEDRRTNNNVEGKTIAIT
jgi:MULE transposase domain